MRVWVLMCLVLLPCLVTGQTLTETETGGAAPVKAVVPMKAVTSTSNERPQPRFFFPSKDWIYGYAEFDIAPPHNEPDPNLCAANSGNYGGANSQCSAFARYVMTGQIELRPFGKPYMRRLKLFAAPTFLFGHTVPQYSYTWSMDPIGWERQWGAAIDLGRRFEMRVTQHFQFQQIGSSAVGPGYLGPNGPWGRSTLVGIRKYFGYASVHDEGVH